MAFSDAVAFAQRLIQTPGLPGREGDVAAVVVAEMHRLGYDEVHTDDVGNVIGVVHGTERASTSDERPAQATHSAAHPPPAVMLSSHLDVVDVGDEATWEYPPFAAVIADGHLHGRGAMDIKGPLAIQTHAAAHFVTQRLACDVIVAHTVQEERGGWGMEHLMNAIAAGTAVIQRPGVVIIGEATNGDICVGHRGRAEIIVDVIGLAGHASAPQRARNPLLVLPLVIPAIQAFAGALSAEPDGFNELLGRATAVPTAIETLPRSRNVIPDIARIVIDWRVLPHVTADAAVGMLRDHLARHVRMPEGFSLDIRYSVEPQQTYTGRTRDRRMFTPGFVQRASHPIVQAAVDVVRAQLGTEPAIRPWTFATDGGHSCGVHGIPTLGFAPGEERFAHTNRERLDLAQAERTFDAYPWLISAVAAAASANR